MTAPPSGAARPLTAEEDAVIRVLDDACRHLGLDDGLPPPIRAGLETELRAREPRAGQASSAGDPAEVEEREWAEIGAAAAVGVLFASGLHGLKRRKRRAPASAGFEPLELARLSSGALVSLLVRRWVRARLDRGRRDGGSPEGPA
jgi:hypothetical protein